MDTEPLTRSTLLVRLRDRGGSSAWTQFVEVYGPLVYRYARRRGLQDADAADLTQDVLRAVVQAIDRFRYDAARRRR
jgi:RNA polymerase sigma-70 factor (ECF subfamily)